ncbi:MAG: superoxide dismutase family protein [Candidatus Omnitrophica bacterium]|nr:superoxide dismutase family protein [Candidatus Omnitrophota bacterium]
MNKSFGWIGLFLLVVLPAFPLQAQSEAAKQARAAIMDAQGKEIGTALFSETPGGVDIAVRVSGLSPGPHGIHVHENGICEGPDFKSAGGHFNPTGKEHGLNNPNGSHCGDLPNLEAGADGTADTVLTLHGVTLGDGPNSLLKPGGTALIIHASQDDAVTDPAGNSGARIACGVIRGEG